MKKAFHVLLALGLLLAASSAAEVKLSMDKAGVEINAGAAGKFILGFPKLGAMGNDGYEMPVADASGKKAVAKYASGAEMQIEISGDEITYRFSSIPDHANSWMTMMAIPGRFSEGGKFGLEGKPIQDFPAVAGTEQHIAKGNKAEKLILISPSGDGFILTSTTNWFSMQDNRAKGWGNQFVYSFLYDIRAYPGVNEFKVKVEAYKP